MKFVDSTPVKELVIWSIHVRQPWINGWIPCQEPERPLDIYAAVTHVKNGEPCGGCALAKEAFIKQNAPYSKET